MSKRRKITLIILLILTAVLGVLSVVVSLYIQENRSPTTSNASTGPGYTNVCGSGTAANWTNRSQCSGCNSSGSCSGNFVYKFTCVGYQTECKSNQIGPSSFQDKSGSCGNTVQIDVFSGANFDGLTDYFVYYEGDCSSNPPPGNPIPPSPLSCNGTVCSGSGICCPSGYQCISSGYCIRKILTCGQSCGGASSTQPTDSCVDGLICINGACKLEANTSSPTCTLGSNTATASATCSGGTPIINISWSKDDVPASSFVDYGVQLSTTSSFTNSAFLGILDENVTSATAPNGSWLYLNAALGSSTLQSNTTYYIKVLYQHSTAGNPESNVVTATTTSCSQTASCGQACNPGNNITCSSGLTCLDGSNNATSGAGTCKLATNPTSSSCTAPTTVSCSQACDNTNTVCGSGQTCSGGTCKLNSCISNPGSCSVDGCNSTTSVSCGQSCDSTHLCQAGNTCSAGTCKLNSCVSNPSSCTNNGCTSTTTVTCGTSCDATHLCDTAGGYQCSAGTCKLNQCVSNPSSCNNNGCTPIVQVACGQACDTNHVCDTSNGYQCNAGTCKLNSCVSNPSSCINNGCTTTQQVACGASCDATHLCDTANGYQCSGGTCKMNICVSSPSSCINNGCTQIQQVACGASCDAGHVCDTANGYQCASGTCKLNQCVSSPGSCTDASCTLASCSDAICSTGEKCEVTTVGGSTYRACTAGDISGGTAPTGSLVPSCQMSGVTACQQNPPACGDALCDTGELCEQISTGATAYKACTASDITNHTAPSGGVVPSCQMTGANKCQQSPPICGDAQCNTGELCEQTSPGATTYKACTAANDQAPTGNDVPSCQMTGSSACQQVPVLSCGSTCTTGADCPNDHSCVSGKCIKNGCTDNNCTNGCIPLCAGPCSVDADCPTNHACVAGKCQLNGCTPNTCINGCTVIPNTGIFDDSNLLFVGIAFMVLGYISFKFKIGRNFMLNLIDNGELFSEKLVKKWDKKMSKKN